jgi:hypothetical protein
MHGHGSCPRGCDRQLAVESGGGRGGLRMRRGTHGGMPGRKAEQWQWVQRERQRRAWLQARGHGGTRSVLSAAARESERVEEEVEE